MLALTRKLGESVIIGDNIKVSVVEIRGKQVCLGIEAPSDMTIHREEVYLKIQEENRQAAMLESVNMKKLMDLFPGTPPGGKTAR